MSQPEPTLSAAIDQMLPALIKAQEAMQELSAAIAIFTATCPECRTAVVPNLLSPVIDAYRLVECPRCCHQWTIELTGPPRTSMDEVVARLDAAVVARGGRPSYRNDLRPACAGCGHTAWAHGEQSGIPAAGEACHAALNEAGAECPCPGGYQAQGGESPWIPNRIGGE